MVDELKMNPKYVGVFFGQKLKHLHGQYQKVPFNSQRIFDLFAFLQQERMDFSIAYNMLKQMFLHPKMDFESILVTLKFKRIELQEVEARIPFLSEKFAPRRKNTNAKDKINALMGQLRKMSEGNVNLTELAKKM
jgi:glutamyl-tRNA(Gln) amidotransferase subunit E